MELLEADEVIQFERLLRVYGFTPSDFSLDTVDMTDPKTDEIPALQGELTIRCALTGQEKHYLISDSTSWLWHFGADLKKGAFLSHAVLNERLPDSRSQQSAH